MTDKITQIINPSFRTGTIKTGKNAGNPYTIMEIMTDSGKKATIFAPAAVGDEVELIWNDQYKNYSASPPKNGAGAQPSLIKPDTLRLDEIDRKLDLILKYVEPKPSDEDILNEVFSDE